MVVDIYADADSTVVRETPRCYGYILACTVRGQLVTREGFGEVTATYHGTVLEAMIRAAGRMRAQSTIVLHSGDAYVLNMLMDKKWEENGFTTAKGSPIANQPRWMQLHRLLKGHEVRTVPGIHEYTLWMQMEMKKGKKNV